jgi:hypothetical protein
MRANQYKHTLGRLSITTLATTSFTTSLCTKLNVHLQPIESCIELLDFFYKFFELPTNIVYVLLKALLIYKTLNISVNNQWIVS